MDNLIFQRRSMIPESSVNSSSRSLAHGSRNGSNLERNPAKSPTNHFLLSESSSAILASIEPPSFSIYSRMPNFNPDQDLVSLGHDEVDLNLPDVALDSFSDEFGPGESSFLLIDGKEHLKVSIILALFTFVAADKIEH
jgi:hypothetical protein